MRQIIIALLLFTLALFGNTPPQITYNDQHQPIIIEYLDGTTTTSEYDAAGRLTSSTDQRGNTTTYTYDAVGNKLSQTDALGNTTTFAYDAQGNLLTVTDALNQTTTYEYNASTKG